MKFEAKTQFDVYYSNNALKTRGCNAISFENKGDVTARINSNYRLLPGQVLNISHPWPEVSDQTQYAVFFDPVDAGSTGTTNELAVVLVYNEPITDRVNTQTNCERL